MNTINQIIKQFMVQGGKLYSLPEIYYLLEEKIHSDTASIDVISDIIRTDSALCVKILKIANSPLYNLKAKITNLNRALYLIGLKEVINLILLDSISNQITSNSSCSVIKMKDFWQRSVYMALIAKRLSIKLKHPEPERVFLAAILSRLGQFVCCAVSPDKILSILQQSISSAKQSEFEIEYNTLGFCYNEVTAELLIQWKIPEEISNIIHTIHTPLLDNNSLNAIDKKDIMILNVATIYSKLLTYDDARLNEEDDELEDITDWCMQAVDPAINAALDINQSVIENILFEVELDSLNILNAIFPKGF